MNSTATRIRALPREETRQVCGNLTGLLIARGAMLDGPDGKASASALERVMCAQSA